MSENHLVLSVHLSDRVKEAVDAARAFPELGRDIKTRVGLHDADGRVCGSGGVILLELVGGEESCNKLHRAARGYRGRRGSEGGLWPRGLSLPQTQLAWSRVGSASAAQRRRGSSQGRSA